MGPLTNSVRKNCSYFSHFGIKLLKQQIQHRLEPEKSRNKNSKSGTVNFFFQNKNYSSFIFRKQLIFTTNHNPKIAISVQKINTKNTLYHVTVRSRIQYFISRLFNELKPGIC